MQAFHNTEEIVVKPLGHHLKESREYAGATILGDGAVALILDAAGLAAKAELTNVAAAQRAKDQEERSEENETQENNHSLLLFRNSPEEYCAVPLGAVRRIERIKPEQLEMAGGRRTMKYREQSLPLVTLADTAHVDPISGARDLAVIVSNIYGREVGLLGAMPVDVADATSDIDSTTHRQSGIAGSSIIRGRTTLIADLAELVDAVYPEWSQAKTGDSPAATAAEKPPSCWLRIPISSAPSSSALSKATATTCWMPRRRAGLGPAAAEPGKGTTAGHRRRDAQPDRVGSDSPHPLRQPGLQAAHHCRHLPGFR